MKKIDFLKNLFFVLLFFMLSAGGNLYGTPVSENGKPGVEGLQLVNECGKPLLLRGICSHGLQWFPDCLSTPEIFDFLFDTMGFNLLRLTNIIPPEYNGYLNDPEYWRGEINKLVDICEERGVYIIIDWHVLYSGDPMVYVAEAADFWESMATEHTGKKHVIYEICNEPNSGSTADVGWDRVKEYANIIIPIIRSIDEDTVILTGTPVWSGDLSGPAIDPLPYDNLMYTMHFYAASEYHHRADRLEPYIDKLPVFISEWGTSNHDGDYPLDLENASDWLDYMEGDNPENILVSWAIWSIGDKDEGSSLLLPETCPGPYGLSCLTENGYWIYDRLRQANPGFSCYGFLRGDVNSDGQVDMLDALLTARYSVGLPDSGCSAFNKNAADMNDDCVIDILDAYIICLRYAGIFL